MAETNRLNIYLIKQNRTIDDVFKEELSVYRKIEFAEGTLYYNPKAIHTPDWVQGFFRQNLTETKMDSNGREQVHNIFNSASSQAVFIKNISYCQKDYLYAISFGSGYQLLKSDAYEPNFGLKCVINLVSGDNCLRKISKYDISSSPKQTSQQLSKKGSQIDFNIDYQTDILTGITGTLNDKDYKEKILMQYIGKSISGGNSFSVNARADISNVDKILKISSLAYNIKKYKYNGFSWIDNVSYIRSDNILLNKLNQKLNDELSLLEEENSKIWLAVPEIIKWEDVQGFYFGQHKKSVYDDLNIMKLKEYIEKQKRKEFNIEGLKNTHIYAKNAKERGYLHCWDAFQCLNAEVEIKENQQIRTFILINKNWYEINKDFQRDTDAKFENYFNQKSGINFIECSFKDEKEYNENLSSVNQFICLDRKNIHYGGRTDQIELCDILDEQNKNLIHIKKYSGSSVLSHLFSQGLVSMQTLLRDSKFKAKAERTISKTKGEKFVFDNIRQYSVVYVIIAKPEHDTVHIPFFSKVNLNSVCDRLCTDMNIKVKFDTVRNVYKSEN